MAIENFDIEVPRNGDWRRHFVVLDDESTDRFDITGATIELSVKSRAGDADPPIASATTAIVSGPDGHFTVHLSGDQFNAVSGQFEIVRLAYDLKVTQDGDDNILARGAILLTPGVS